MTRIYLIRHAEAEGNLYRRVHGWYNSLITVNGYRQIDALAERFRKIPVDAVYSSDLFRTMTTAGAICKTQNLPLTTDPGLREVNMGQWEDRPWGEIARTDGENLALFNATSPDWKAPGGEGLEEVRRRVGGTVKRLAARHAGQTVAVFCHGTAIRNTLALFQGLSVAESAGLAHSDNTAVSLVEFDGETPRVVFQDDNSHLPEKISTLGRQKWWKSGTGSLADANLWYRPMDLEREGGLYYEARREAWMTIHGSLQGFNGEGFLADARFQSRRDERSIICAMLGDKPAGVLQMDFARDADRGVGGIPFYYLTPEVRSSGLGVQLLGQAVSTYRPMGRDRLRLRCAPENTVAQHFYRSHGFEKVGEEPGGCGRLDVMEKYIGYEERSEPCVPREAGR